MEGLIQMDVTRSFIKSKKVHKSSGLSFNPIYLNRSNGVNFISLPRCQILISIYFIFQDPLNFELITFKKSANAGLEKYASHQFIETDESINVRKTCKNSNYFNTESSISDSSNPNLVTRDGKNQQAEWKTYLKVGQMTSNPKHVVPFVIEWVPNLLPRIGIGELTIKFEFGHQKNGKTDLFYETS